MASRRIAIVHNLPERGVSFYDDFSPASVAAHFKEIREHNCNAVLLAVSESDFQSQFHHLKKAVTIARSLGLRVYWNFWAYGKVFGGEASSVFLEENPSLRQVSSKGEPLPQICFNRPAFRDYLAAHIKKVIKEIPEIKGVFFDEPCYCYQYSKISPRGIGYTPLSGWACHCKACQALFEAAHRQPIPRRLTSKVQEFREDRLAEFVSSMAKVVKDVDKDKKVVVIALPERKKIGFSWEKIARIPEVDIFAGELYPGKFRSADYGDEIDKILNICKKYRKGSQVWIKAFGVQKGKERETIVDAAASAYQKGAGSIIAWTYRGAEGKAIACDNPALVWRLIGEVYSAEFIRRQVQVCK